MVTKTLAPSLPKLEALYYFIFQYAAEGIILVNTFGDLTHVNPAAVGMLNMSAETAIGKPAKVVLRPFPALVRLLTLQGINHVDVVLPKERLAVGVAQDLPIGRVAILNDVTEQRDLESRREALVRTIAHDLRNPLNALAGYADLLATSGELNTIQQKFSLRIQQTTNKLYEMAAKLVDLSWIEAGMPLQYVPVELASLTRQAIQEQTPEAHQKQMTIINSIPNELPLVMGDPKRLKQTISNILDNAIRYSHEGGNVMIHAWHHGNTVSYMIADQGIGIAEEDQDKVWDRMWRSEQVRDIAGGGIGLSFAKIILDRHGGDIALESRLGEGTTLTFRLPITRDHVG